MAVGRSSDRSHLWFVNMSILPKSLRKFSANTNDIPTVLLFFMWVLKAELSVYMEIQMSKKSRHYFIRTRRWEGLIFQISWLVIKLQRLGHCESDKGTDDPPVQENRIQKPIHMYTYM